MEQPRYFIAELCTVYEMIQMFDVFQTPSCVQLDGVVPESHGTLVSFMQGIECQQCPLFLDPFPGPVGVVGFS